jgi:hypothetical protein
LREAAGLTKAAQEPVAVLGAAAARRLGIDRVHPDLRIWLRYQWFNVAGSLQPSPLPSPRISSAYRKLHTCWQHHAAFTGGMRRTLRPLAALAMVALGATQGQIRTHFLRESILLAVNGAVVGVLAGAAATAVNASAKSWAS